MRRPVISESMTYVVAWKHRDSVFLADSAATRKNVRAQLNVQVPSALRGDRGEPHTPRIFSYDYRPAPVGETEAA